MTRAYYVNTRLVGERADWDRLCEHVRSMGFESIAIAPPFVAAGDGPFLIADYARIEGGKENDALETLAHWAKRAAQHDLRLLLDIAIDRCAANNLSVRALPDAYRLGGTIDDAPPDPRRGASQHAVAVARFADVAAREPLIASWNDRLRSWLEAGVAGFRAVAPQRMPAAVWQQLIAKARTHRPEARWLAWTPGARADELDALSGAGFDATFSSLPWWDFRAAWMLMERARLAALGASIAPVEEPFGARVAATNENVDTRRRAALRVLQFATATADGLFVPMGFEHGARSPLASRADASRDPAAPSYDITSEIAAANAALAARLASTHADARDLAGPGAPLVAWLILDGNASARVVVANADLDRVVAVRTQTLLERAGEFSRWSRGAAEHQAQADQMSTLALEPGDVVLFRAEKCNPIQMHLSEANIGATAAASAPRIAIERLRPTVDDGAYPVKRTVGECVRVDVDVFADGHDLIAVELQWRAADEQTWQRVRMQHGGNDEWFAEFPLERLGRYAFSVEAWRDVYATFRSEAEKKRAARSLSAVDIEEGVGHIRRALERTDSALAADLRRVVAALDKADEARKVDVLLQASTAQLMARADARPFLVRSAITGSVDAERVAARYASWYELFPRSQSGDAARHGTFDDVIARLPAIRAMGFDVLYMPPIHPIGTAHRKGRNNSLRAEPGDPGSPYAIGSADGGHEAIHPQLGTADDFERLRTAAQRHGLELALDFAIQCSPDHPWLKQHPEWFAWRSDGSVRYAENPPKKYEDIVNVDFYGDGAVPALWVALRDVVLLWVERGVRLFRVDNPHTKPFPFWQWIIADVRARHPDVVFLAEAFTRPKIMYRLAKLGFSQSYTYFTWRNTKVELTDYLTELTTTAPRDFFRPHFFVNTPDINPTFLQQSGRAGFLIRAALATTLSGLWGMYSGFELCEAEPMPGKEDYLHSEKYEIKARDWNAPGNIVREISQLNAIRRANPALQTHLGVTFYSALNDRILYFAKATAARDNVVLVAINLDPHAAQEADFEVPLWEWNLPDDASMIVEDLLRDRSSVWHGKIQHVSLDPAINPYAIWRIRPSERS